MKPRFKLYRKMRENQIIMKDQSSLAIWVYLLLNAMDQPMDSIFNNEIIKLQPGQLITSRKRISIDLNINESKVQRELQMFEKGTMIEQQTNTQNRLITIVNWSHYQDSEQQMNDRGTTNEHNNKIEIIDRDILSSKEDNSLKREKENPVSFLDDDLSPIIASPPTPSPKYQQINSILQVIKDACGENGIVYSAKDERIFGKHLLSKKFAEVASGFGMNQETFVKNVIKVSMTDTFRSGKICSAKSVYQNYPQVINSVKNKNRHSDLSIDFL